MSYCLNPRVPAAGGEVASEWETSVWIGQSDHGATWRRALFSGCGGFGAFWLRVLCVQGQQQAGEGNVLCQTESGDVTVAETSGGDSSTRFASFGRRVFRSRPIWSLDFDMTCQYMDGQLFTATQKGCLHIMARQKGCVHEGDNKVWTRIHRALRFTGYRLLVHLTKSVFFCYVVNMFSYRCSRWYHATVAELSTIHTSHMKTVHFAHLNLIQMF